MDIEPPHHPIETKRDFFIHLFTITCGLLIALSLESLVEWGHHRALVREARENIRREIEHNRETATEDSENLKKDVALFQANLSAERTLRDNRKARGLTISSSFSWNSTNDSAWRTARDTGALAYMPYGEVQRYADVYNQQAIVNNLAIQLFRQQSEAIAPVFSAEDPSSLEREEFTRLIHDTATAYIDAVTLGQTLTQLRDQYTTALKAH